MFIRNLLTAFAVGSTVLLGSTLAEEESARVNSFQCGPRFQKPSFASVDDFIQAAEALKDPWRELLEPDKGREPAQPEEIGAPRYKHTDVVYRSKDQAIVFSETRAYRYAPFSAVIFLLSKKGNRFHVRDFIRRSEGDESSSWIQAPRMLKLEPHGCLHLYFTEYRGGRKWGFDTDEFYTVMGSRLRPTLILKNDGAYLSPADPYREFEQDAKVSVARHGPRISIDRMWSYDGRDDQKERFSIVFHWNSRLGRFTSKDASKLTLKQPESWSGAVLPRPPNERP